MNNAVQVTSTELYAINMNPEFIKQTGLDDNLAYKMYWKIAETIYVTVTKLF